MLYLDADGELRDHASGVWTHDGGAQNLSARVFLHGDLGEPLGDPFALAPVHVRQLALFVVLRGQRKEKTTDGVNSTHSARKQNKHRVYNMYT